MAELPVDEGEEEEIERVAGKLSEYSRSSWIEVAGRNTLQGLSLLREPRV